MEFGESGNGQKWMDPPSDIKGHGLGMSRSFGDFVSKEIGVSCHIDVFRFELMEYDKFLIVTSNWVWENISNDKVFNLTINKKNSKEFCEYIISVNTWKERFKNNFDDISDVAVNGRKG